MSLDTLVLILNTGCDFVDIMCKVLLNCIGTIFFIFLKRIVIDIFRLKSKFKVPNHTNK